MGFPAFHPWDDRILTSQAKPQELGIAAMLQSYPDAEKVNPRGNLRFARRPVEFILPVVSGLRSTPLPTPAPSRFDL